jgi:hypothetical protein
MFDYVNSIFKSSVNIQRVESIDIWRCPACKAVFEQEEHNQRFCSNIKCRNKRHVIWQTEYRQRKKVLETQEEVPA